MIKGILSVVVVERIMVECIIYALGIFIYKVSLLQSVEKLLCKRTTVGVYRMQRTANLHLICVHSCPSI